MESVYIQELWVVVESDHAAVGVNVEWKVRRKGKCRMKEKSKRKRRVTARNWELSGSQMEDLSSVNVAMAQVGEEIDNWCETRSGWVNDKVNNVLLSEKVRIESIGK